MSEVRLKQKINPATATLRDRLTREYQNPAPGQVEPLLIELADKRHYGATHLYVIWQDWNQLDNVARSEIIMEAYEEARGAEAALNVAVAMGLTPAEATRMGIEFEMVENPA